VELAELNEHMAEVESKRTVEAMQLSRSVMEISDVLVGLGVFPIRDIPEQPRSTQDVLMAASLVLEHLREEGTCLRRQSLGQKLDSSGIAPAPGYPTCHLFLCAFGAYVMYISIFLHM
jgi:hypothetical protein